MANITAAMVKDLRDKTGAGMMDCKQALNETNGDMDAAIDWLRKKGLSKAAKKAGRVAAEGLIGLALAPGKGVVVEVNSETDFVARNEQFQGLVKMIAQVALTAGDDVAKINAAKVGDITVERRGGRRDRHHRREHDAAPRQGAVGRQGRRRRPMSTIRSSTASARSACWSRSNSAARPTKLAALGRQLAMHVAAANPLALDSASLDPDVVAREKDVLADKYRQQGKPENVIEKIVDSGLKTFYKEVCLLDQAYIHDDGKSVAQALKEAEGKVGAPVKVTGFVRYALGEGIEKQESDFAAEVKKASGQG